MTSSAAIYVQKYQLQENLLEMATSHSSPWGSSLFVMLLSRGAVLDVNSVLKISAFKQVLIHVVKK